MSKRGSLVYQMQEALKGVFRPGRRRYHDKEYGRGDMIRGIQTMQCMVADASQFAHFIRKHWPDVRSLDEVTPEMAQAFIAEHIRRENSGGYIGRLIASLRKLDAACRHTGIFTPDRQPLLPNEGADAVSGFHSDPRPLPYTDKQAEALISDIARDNPTIALLLQTMWMIGLRVNEATYLRAQDIDVETGMVALAGNENHTKGGCPWMLRCRDTIENSCQHCDPLESGDPMGTSSPLVDRSQKRARQRVRKACRNLGIPPLGTHGFRKTFAVDDYRRNREAGQSDPEALLNTARQLGHNRSKVTRDSYVPPQVRRRD